MAKITFIQPNGTEQTIDIKTGQTVMEGAVKHNIRGIDADCGGACACATCHVYVDASWFARLEPRSTMEAATIEFAEDIEPTSRLSCQIRVTAALDGMIVRLPPAP
jgi:2Fe-2S ferredoxin